MTIGDMVVLKVHPKPCHLNSEGKPWDENAPIPKPGDVGKVSYTVTWDNDFGCVTFPSGAILSSVTFSTDCYDLFEGLCYQALHDDTPTPYPPFRG